MLALPPLCGLRSWPKGGVIRYSDGLLYESRILADICGAAVDTADCAGFRDKDGTGGLKICR